MKSDFDFDEFINQDCKDEAKVSETAVRTMMAKLYNKAIKKGYIEGFVDGFARAKEAYNKTEVAGE